MSLASIERLPDMKGRGMVEIRGSLIKRFALDLLLVFIAHVSVNIGTYGGPIVTVGAVIRLLPCVSAQVEG
ncbi:hypothetical protein E2C01_025559 [Portunus trituberculatus]|uniref:Uncharacterized protein n=1 Tax=Portunus trituberculatus TaxID=210409 RepID=A0A5B7EDP1_PORTR|nr:hypothetical protein [Portunus trituberculatus]